MSHTLMVSIFIISTVHIIAFVLLIAFSTYIYLKANKDRMLYNFLAVQGAFFIWILAKILKTVSPVFELRWFFVGLQYFGICVLEVAFIQFAYHYYKGKALPKWLWGATRILALSQFIFIATNEYHHLFYSRFDFNGDDFGTFFYYHVIIMYTFILTGIFMVGKKFRKDFYHNKKFYEISIAIIIPLLANIYYLSGYYHELMIRLNWRAFDITPIAFELSLTIFAYAIYKKDFLDLMPVFEDEIIRHIRTGVIIFDKYNNIIEQNNSAKEFLKDPWESGSLINEDQEIDRIYQVQSNKFLHVQKKRLIGNKNKFLGYIMTIMDVSSYMILKNNIELQVEELRSINYELKDKIKLSDTLTKVSARNYVARELHDILGHSMTVSIKLLEIAKMECESDDYKGKSGFNQKTMESVNIRLGQAFGICSEGYLNLRKSLIEKQEMSYDLISLKTEVNKMGNVISVAGIEFELVMEKVNGLLNEVEYQTIKRFCQECMTNAIKHGRASKISIKMEFCSAKNEIAIRDNGIGCNEFTKGSGLRGMEERASAVGGEINYFSKKGQGFLVELVY